MSHELSDGEDPTLQPKKLLDELKHLQATVATTMQGDLMKKLNSLTSFSISSMYKLEVHKHLDKLKDLSIPDDVNDISKEHVV
uniref:Uncharacterized protein n=1 Tax=Romanomermis culicivorax TaxID=13658 RepID=A0A915JFU7_ROMCU